MDYASWAAKVQAETGLSPEELAWRTVEQIDVQPLYTKKDCEGLEHLDYIRSFLRSMPSDFASSS